MTYGLRMSMFKNLSRFNIGKIELGIPVTFPIGLQAILRGTRVLDYLYAKEKEDYSQSEYTRKRPGTGNFDIEALVELEELTVRFMSRMTSYIITVCTIDGILKQSYVHFINCLKQIGYDALIPADCGESLIDQRRAEINNYLFYRNKVFAHTAFGFPVKEDSLSLRYSSLEYFSGNLIYLKDKYLALGGGSLIVDKEEKPPELSIVKEHPSLRKHYSLWERMFTDILKNIPKEELKTNIEKIRLI